jgi:hypothetical protein
MSREPLFLYRTKYERGGSFGERTDTLAAARLDCHLGNRVQL